MKKLLLILIFVFIPTYLFASDKILSKNEACNMKDGEYTFVATLTGYDLLEARWKNGDAKVYGFLKQGSKLYYGVNASVSEKNGRDLYIFEYSCNNRKSLQLSFIIHVENDFNEVFISSLGDNRYFKIWGGVRGGGGGNWGIIDSVSKKYYQVIDYPDFRKLSSKCDGPEGCFTKFSVEKGNVYVYFSESTESEKLHKYRIDLIGKRLYKN